MKKSMIILAAFGLFVFTPTAILAQNDGGAKELTIINDGNEVRKKYQLRLEDFKSEVEERYNEAKGRLLEKKCENVITKIENARDGSSKFHESHNNIYANWRERLANLSGRLAASGIDTTTLEGLLEELDTLLGSNNSDIQAYLAEVGDLTIEQCQENPKDFYTKLQDLRAARKLIIEDHKETIQFIKENIKAELLGIKSSLDVKVDSQGAE